MFAFAGPGYLVAVGYMDPGNWATDLAGGARYGYTLLSVIMMSNLMAMLLQALAARLGIASGRDLAQACRDSYSRPVVIVLWVLCEIAIAACDLAEVIGAAIALNCCSACRSSGALPDRARRADRPLSPAPRLPLRRSAGHRAHLPDRRVVRRRAVARAAGSRGRRRRLHSADGDPAQSEHALHRDRHPRRHGDAAQPVPALVDRADAQVLRHGGRQGRSDPLRDDRLGGRADVRAVHQRARF